MKIIKFNLFENTANNTQGNTKGMGNVKSPQPSKETGKVNELPSETRIPEPVEKVAVKEEPTNEGVKSFLNFLNENNTDQEVTLEIINNNIKKLYGVVRNIEDVTNDLRSGNPTY